MILRHSRRAASIICGAMFAVLSCSTPTGPSSSDILRAEASPPTLTLANLGARTVYPVIFERETATRISFMPCLDPAICDGLAPSATRTLPYSEITGYHAGAREAVVYHWQLVANPAGGFLPDSMRALIVRLR